MTKEVGLVMTPVQVGGGGAFERAERRRQTPRRLEMLSLKQD